MIISLQVIRGLFNIRLARTLRWVDWLCGILPNTESHTGMSFPLPLPWNLTLHCSILLNLVSCLPWNLTLHCSIWLNGVLPAMESDSALFYLTQRCPVSVESDSALLYLTQWCPACRGIWLCIVLFNSAVFCLPWNLTLHCSILLRCLLLTSDFNSTASCTPQSLTPRCSWSQYVMYMFSFNLTMSMK